MSLGQFRSSPETFEVDEIPAYAPSGTGSHTFVRIEKRGLTTFQAVERLARLLDRPVESLGHAGMKDKHATTRQWVSVPEIDPALALALEDSEIKVLEAARHGNKLKTGHLKGNRFGVTVSLKDAANLTKLVSRAELLRSEGLPNRYGDQRFGVSGDNAARGLALLRGDARIRDGKQRRLLVSAAQAAVFNNVLDERIRQGLLRTVLGGDVLQKTDTQGVFISEDKVADQARLDTAALVTTGPMPGSWAKMPPEGSEAANLESTAFEALGAPLALFRDAGKDLPGTRRPLLIPVPDLTVEAGTETTSARLAFSLPSGGYATVVLAALGIDLW